MGGEAGAVRHCERGEAIKERRAPYDLWIASSLALLAMTACGSKNIPRARATAFARRRATTLRSTAIFSEACRRERVAAWAYCLTPNHVHLILTPQTPEGLGRAAGSPGPTDVEIVDDH